jgi:urease accessory protein
MNTRSYGFIATAMVGCGLLSTSALAHTQGHGGSGFAAGLTHPWFGLDHLLAMVTVGLLAVRSANPSSRTGLWAVPAAFVGLMAIGAGLAYAGMPLPGAEWGIAFSVVLFGLLVAALATVPVAAAVPVVGLFAIFHGYAHVAEMSGTIVPYGVGMLLGTAVLHGLGVAAGLAMGKVDPRAVRISGAAIAGCFAIVLLLGL